MNVRASLPIAFAMGVFAFSGSYVQAAEPAPGPGESAVTITGTRVQTMPYDFAVRRPVKEITVTGTVPADLNVLTLNSGVALLQDSVRDAARKVCLQADPDENATSDETMNCVRQAVREAQPQINALVQRAHEEERARAG